VQLVGRQVPFALPAGGPVSVEMVSLLSSTDIACTYSLYTTYVRTFVYIQHPCSRQWPRTYTYTHTHTHARTRLWM
jgi:hypothetical protein